jgi:hypothetical protein
VSGDLVAGEAAVSSTYAGAKGRPISSPSLPLKGREEKAELSDDEKAVIAERVRLVKKHMPDAWAFMKALSAEGMIDGMRSLASVTVFEGVNHGAG